jgi:hypothetical protein
MVKRIGVSLALGLVIALTLMPHVSWAGGGFVAVHSGDVSVFFGSGHPFVHGHQHFAHRGFFHPVVSPFFVPRPVIVAAPVPRPVWVPGGWNWNGFQWVWVPGHWGY